MISKSHDEIFIYEYIRVKQKYQQFFFLQEYKLTKFKGSCCVVTTNSTGSLLPWLQIFIMMTTSQSESSFLIAKNGEAEGIDGRMGKGPRDGVHEVHTIYKLSANSPCFIIDRKLSPTIYEEKN